MIGDNQHRTYLFDDVMYIIIKDVQVRILWSMILADIILCKTIGKRLKNKLVKKGIGRKRYEDEYRKNRIHSFRTGKQKI